MPTIENLKELFGFIQEAPQSIRAFLEWPFWLLIFLFIMWAILRILLSEPFKKLYQFVGARVEQAGNASRTIAITALKNLELPEPYPRLTRIFKIYLMANQYAASLIFLFIAIIVALMLAFSTSATFKSSCLATIFILLFGYFAWFFFAQAENDRVALFKAKPKSDS